MSVTAPFWEPDLSQQWMRLCADNVEDDRDCLNLILWGDNTINRIADSVTDGASPEDCELGKNTITHSVRLTVVDGSMTLELIPRATPDE